MLSSSLLHSAPLLASARLVMMMKGGPDPARPSLHWHISHQVTLHHLTTLTLLLSRTVCAAVCSAGALPPQPSSAGSLQCWVATHQLNTRHFKPDTFNKSIHFRYKFTQNTLKQSLLEVNSHRKSHWLVRVMSGATWDWSTREMWLRQWDCWLTFKWINIYSGSNKRSHTTAPDLLCNSDSE